MRVPPLPREQGLGPFLFEYITFLVSTFVSRMISRFPRLMASYVVGKVITRPGKDWHDCERERQSKAIGKAKVTNLGVEGRTRCVGSNLARKRGWGPTASAGADPSSSPNWSWFIF